MKKEITLTSSKIEPNEQKLVNYCFEFAMLASKYMKDRPYPEIAEWVAYNLAAVGFHTRPVGSMWGKLYTPEPKSEEFGWEIVEAGRPD